MWSVLDTKPPFRSVPQAKKSIIYCNWIQIGIQIVFLGFGRLGHSISHSRRKEKRRAYLEDALVAGKGLGEDVTNGAAARRVVAAREGRAEGSPREGKGSRKQREEMNLRPEP